MHRGGNMPEQVSRPRIVLGIGHHARRMDVITPPLHHSAGMSSVSTNASTVANASSNGMNRSRASDWSDP